MHILKPTFFFALVFLLPGLSYSQCATDAWLSCDTAANPHPARQAGHWIMYDFGYVYALGQSQVWNYNDLLNHDNGLRDIVIDYSLDGVNWQEWGTWTLQEATGLPDYGGQNGPHFSGIEARYLLITGLSNWGGACYGMAELKIELGNECVLQEFVDVSVCPGESWEGYTQSGTYVDTFSLNSGCDSIRQLNLTVLPALDTTYAESFTCDPSSQGTQIQSLQSAFGCDSLVATTLTYYPIAVNLEFVSASGGEDNGSAQVMPMGEQGPYDILWSTGETGMAIQNLAPGSYSVTITDANGCSTTEDFTITTITRVTELGSLQEFKVFPNPANDQFQVILVFDRVENGWLSLHDQLGREIRRERVTGSTFQTRFPVKTLPGGNYQVRLVTDSGESVRQLIVR